VAHNFIDKAGAWYSYQGDRIGQGKENVRQFLKDNPDMAAAIEKQIRDALMPKKVKGEKAPAAEEAVEE